MKTFVKTFDDNTAYVVHARSRDAAMLVIDSIGDPTDYANGKSSLTEIKETPWMIEILPKQTLCNMDEYLPKFLEDFGQEEEV
jgi:hypothetical protein